MIHTVGPRWNQGKSEEEIKLRNCYVNSMKLAEENQLETLAFPNISTGIYRFPKQLAAEIAVETIKNIELKYVQKVIFVCYDDENFKIYEDLIKE